MTVKVPSSFSMPDSPVIHIFMFQGKYFLGYLSMQFSTPSFGLSKVTQSLSTDIANISQISLACFLLLARFF